MQVQDYVLMVWLMIQNDDETGEVVDWMEKNLFNLCRIEIYDYMNPLDQDVHNKLIKLVDQSHLLFIHV